MSWSPQMGFHYVNTGFPYSTTGSFIDYFEGLTYEHVNFIFAGASHGQENLHPSMNNSFYKYELSEPGNSLCYDHSHGFEVNYHSPRIDGYRRPLENSSTMTYDEHTTVNTEWGVNTTTTTNATTNAYPSECPRSHNNARDFQVVWQDNIDPDNMSYEELLELGEAVGTQSRGLSQELISMLPISKYKRGFFSRRKSRDERCVICQMEYKRKDQQITLPCKHVYHAGCGTKWLSINKACPICYTEVFGNASKH